MRHESQHLVKMRKQKFYNVTFKVISLEKGIARAGISDFIKRN